MTHIFDTSNLKSYVYAYGKPKLEMTMQYEIDYFQNNQTWDLVPRSTENNVVKCQYVYHRKFTSDNALENHKYHLAVKGFSQQEDIKYTYIFAHVANMNYVWLILSLSPCFGWSIHRMDVKSTFSAW